MEYDFADRLDLEWHSIFEKHLKYFSDQGQSETYSFDEILKEVFCSDPDTDVKSEDKEIFEKCLLEALNLLLSRQTFPRQIQIRFVLNIAKYVVMDESCFINLSANNVVLNLIYLSQPSTEENTKVAFMEFLRSFLEHPSGVKWLMETGYFTEVFTFATKYEKVDDPVSKMGYDILKILLEKTVDMDKNYCTKIVALIANPLLNKAQQITSKIMDKSFTFDELKPYIICLVGILEGLLKDYSANVLQHITELKVGHACEVISEKCTDEEICLFFDRISIIFSFFGLTVVFDGIKSIQQDPLVLSGFTKIIDKNIDKGLFTGVFELFHYALKYHQYVSDKLPKYFFRDKEIDTETQLLALQLEPILLEWTRVDDATEFLEGTDAHDVPITHLLQIFKNLSLKTLHIGFQIRNKLPTSSFHVYTKAVESILRSKDLYSKKSLCLILNTLVYALEAPLRYLQSKKNENVIIEDGQQVYILALLEATLVFIESFNLDWPDSFKVLDLLYIVIEGCSSYEWIEPIMMDSLLLLQEIISRRLSPSMALLIDTADGLKNIGPLLYKTCFTKNWKVRRAVVDLVHTITLSANNCFSSFKTILIDASLPSLITTMALNDESFHVRATALKCLQEMIVMEDVEEILPKQTLIYKILEIIMKNVDAEVTAEAIKLINTIYNHETYLTQETAMKIYQCLEYISLSNNDNDKIQKEAVQFWRNVTRKFLTNKGWVETILKFPPVTFSKRIIPLTTKEVNKRCYKVLSELSRIGCLNVFKKFFEASDLHVDVKKSVNETLDRFHYIFSSHKVSPKSMLLTQEFFELYSMQIESLITPQETDAILKDIISERVMEITPAELDFTNNKDPFAFVDSNHLNISGPSTTVDSTSDVATITPSEFVALVNKKVSELLSNGEGYPFEDSKETEVYVIDY